ncbi:MAG: tyrosine-type recombinase/integrase, partial [bacterium]|nr:tyrosine-type recombinase/integrase [bacterium]
MLLGQLQGVPRLMALLLYGAGLRVLECARLRVKDIGVARNQIIVRAGKGDRDRVTMLPASVKADLVRHLDRARRQYEQDLTRGAGWVELPGHPGLRRPGDRPAAPAPPARDRAPAGGQGRCPPGRDCQARDLP